MAVEEVAAWAAAGVYVITNTQTGEQYVGRARLIAARWGQEIASLRAGTCHNKHLQAAWAQYGEAAFTFEVLEQVQHLPDLPGRERAWIAHLKPAYNIRALPKAEERPPSPRELRTAEVRARRQAAMTSPARHSPKPTLAKVRAAMSMNELAAAAGVAASTVLDIERGAKPRMATIRKLARALGMAPQDIDWPGDPFGAIEDDEKDDGE